ncbi:MAG: protease inhibitor I9 family protein, partial [Candidatus Aureabacteria bacterium]|nr:protease inhibitor I9 family protein [Candidatus Auribacterota bacterium]
MKRLSLSILTIVVVLFNSNALGSIDISKGVIPEHYIVVLSDDVGQSSLPDVANEMAKSHGLKIGHVYRHALKGFSAVIPDARLEKLKSDPRVKRIDADRVIYAMPKPPGKGKPPKEDNPPPPQVLPTGIDR